MYQFWSLIPGRTDQRLQDISFMGDENHNSTAQVQAIANHHTDSTKEWSIDKAGRLVRVIPDEEHDDFETTRCTILVAAQ